MAIKRAIALATAVFGGISEKGFIDGALTGAYINGPAANKSRREKLFELIRSKAVVSVLFGDKNQEVKVGAAMLASSLRAGQILERTANKVSLANALYTKGKVANISIAVGDSIRASDSRKVIIIVGEGHHENVVEKAHSFAALNKVHLTSLNTLRAVTTGNGNFRVEAIFKPHGRGGIDFPPISAVVRIRYVYRVFAHRKKI